MTSSNKPYSISLLIYGYKVLSTSSVANLGSDSYIFHFPENADIYVVHQQDCLPSCQLRPTFPPAWKEGGAIRL